jgi:hypothetical protein
MSAQIWRAVRSMDAHPLLKALFNDNRLISPTKCTESARLGHDGDWVKKS